MRLLIDIPDTTYAFVKELQGVIIGRGNCKTIQQTVINAIKFGVKQPQGEWIITAEDNEGIHRIQCPFCRYEKGSDFIDYITVTFEKLPPFCESCGAELKCGAE